MARCQFKFSAIIAASVVGLFKHTIEKVIALAMVMNLVFAVLSGVIIPVMVRLLGIDLAIASGVILIAVTEVVGFSAFHGLATLFLNEWENPTSTGSATLATGGKCAGLGDGGSCTARALCSDRQEGVQFAFTAIAVEGVAR